VGKFETEYFSYIILLFHSFRTPAGPALGLIPSLIKDAIIIAIVSFAICISLAKTYAKKFKYVVDSNQELAAYGLCNVSC
jgi:MFS superfamily sulfate permease-like transporter